MLIVVWLLLLDEGLGSVLAMALWHVFCDTSALLCCDADMRRVQMTARVQGSRQRIIVIIIVTTYLLLIDKVKVIDSVL